MIDIPIPQEFKIANQVIKVSQPEFIIEDGEYYFGWFSCTKNEIRVARRIKSGGEIIDVEDEARKNTFWHEVYHCFNYFWNTETDECLAQSFANFTREFLATANAE